MTNSTSNKPAGRVLKDLSAKLSDAELLALLKERGLTTSSSDKEPKAYVGDYTPKKGKDMGKTSRRLFIEGNFFPVILKQEPCKVIIDNLDVIKAFAETGK